MTINTKALRERYMPFITGLYKSYGRDADGFEIAKSFALEIIPLCDALDQREDDARDLAVLMPLIEAVINTGPVGNRSINTTAVMDLYNYWADMRPPKEETTMSEPTCPHCERPMILHAGTDDEMCPNCVTPWKCNGPHEPAETQHIKDPTRTWTIPDDLEGGGHVGVGCIDTCPACAEDTLAYERHLLRQKRMGWEWCLASNLAVAGALCRAWALGVQYVCYQHANKAWVPNSSGVEAPLFKY
jgi:hypothetical protein